MRGPAGLQLSVSLSLSAPVPSLRNKPRRGLRAVWTATPRSHSHAEERGGVPASASLPEAGLELAVPRLPALRATRAATGAQARRLARVPARAGERRGGGAARVRAQLAAGRAHSPRLPRESSGSRKRRFPAHAQLAGRARAEPRRREGGGRGGKLLR